MTRKIVVWSVGGLFAVIVLCFALVFVIGAVNRYQARADAKNAVLVAKKRVGIATLNAQARYQESLGIRKAQDEIAKTLTPLYVAYEMTQAMQNIATSGNNNTVIYLPTDPKSGLPVVPTSNSASGGK